MSITARLGVQEQKRNEIINCMYLKRILKGYILLHETLLSNSTSTAVC